MITDEYNEYKDSWGLVQPEGKTSQNGIRFTAEYAYALSKADLTSDILLDEVTQLIKAIGLCEGVPGLFNRAPDSTEQIGPDDMYGLALFSFLFYPEFARRAIEHGGWLGVWNNEKPFEFSPKAFLGRQRPLIACLKRAAGLKVSWVDQFITCAVLLFHNKDQDGFMLTSFVATIWRHSWMNWACKLFFKRFERYYPRGMGELMTAYFGHYHAHTKWLDRKFGG